jgi:hypothetical protein
MRRVQRYWRRWTIRYFRRPLRALLSRTTVAIREHVPGASPLIVWSSRAASLDLLSGVLGVPSPTEMPGMDDIAPERRLGRLLRLWNFIPFLRPQLDQVGLKTTTDLLKAGDALHVFRQEFIGESDWHQRLRSAGLSVVRLSSLTGVPLLPVGVGDPVGAIDLILRWERARLNPTPLVSPLRAVGEELMQRIGALPLRAAPDRYALDAKERFGQRVRLAGFADVAVTLPAHLRVAPQNPIRRERYVGKSCDAPRSPPRA